jgi:Na+-transporting methylmalonyl-CoA/oxaloacetate decarboxylase gamma subunit
MYKVFCCLFSKLIYFIIIFSVDRDTNRMVKRFEAILRNRISCGELEKSINSEEYRNFPSLPVFPDEKEDKKTIEQEITAFFFSNEGIVITTLGITNCFFLLGFLALLFRFRKIVSQMRQSILDEPILMAELALPADLPIPQQEEPNLIPVAPLAEAE